MEDIIEMGFERILTSGDKSTAIEGARRIAELNQTADGRILLMPGGGINESNVGDIIAFTGVTEVHSSARIRVPSSMIYKNDRIIMSNNTDDEYSIDVTGVQRVKDILKNAIGHTEACS